MASSDGPLSSRLLTALLLAILMVTGATLTGIHPYQETPGKVSPTSADEPPLIVTEDRTIVGIERFGQVEVEAGGNLYIPEGSILYATGLTLETTSVLELSGGMLILSISSTSEVVRLSGVCNHIKLTSGSRIELRGRQGSYDLEGTHGASVEMDVQAIRGIWVQDSTIVLSAGDGNNPDAPITTGDLSKREYAGGHAILNLKVTARDGSITMEDSTIEIEGGDGGDAPDAVPEVDEWSPRPGGFSKGGSISGEVASGGHVDINLVATTVRLHRSQVSGRGGSGGDAGDGADVANVSVVGGAGGGYTGGFGGDRWGRSATDGGEVSGSVGSGGYASLGMASYEYLQIGSAIDILGGHGGDGGDGGSTSGWGGGGGGGYTGGGGGGAVDAVPEGASGGHVKGRVAAGGSASAHFTMDDGMRLDSSSVEVIAGSGGDGGRGGSASDFGGAGGGGYSGGGGGAKGNLSDIEASLMGGSGGLVYDQVGTGGDATLMFDAKDAVLNGCDLVARAGRGGKGGTASTSNEDPYAEKILGGGGGGSYSAGGGGGSLDWPDLHGAGGKGSAVLHDVGDGGNAMLRIDCPAPTIYQRNNITATEGNGGFCYRSSADGVSGGRGRGRITGHGLVHTHIPMSRPILISPADGHVSGDIPTFEWTPVFRSTSHGAVMGYVFQMDTDSQFGSPLHAIYCKFANITLYELVKEKLYWRVAPAYSRPPSKEGPWSEVFEYTHTNAPPQVNPIPVINCTVNVPQTIDLEPYLFDPDDLTFMLYIECENVAVTWTAGFKVTLLYRTVVPDHTVSFNVSDAELTTEGWISVHVIDMNHDPNILGVGKHNPPVVLDMVEGGTLWTYVRTYDRDGDVLTLSISSEDVNAWIFENASIFLEASRGQVGTFRLTIICKDGRGGSARLPVTVRVSNIQDPPGMPVFDRPSNGTVVDEGTLVNFRVTVTDPDMVWGDGVTLTVISNISGVLNTGIVMGDMDFSTAGLGPGRHRITAIVTDGEFTNRSHIEVVVVGKPEKPTVWDPPDYLWTVLAFLAFSLVLLFVGYMIGARRRKMAIRDEWVEYL
jgi:hypothetical protein